MMSTTLDIDALASPFDDENPTGRDLREDVSFDSPYQGLKTVREEAMALERSIQQGSEEGTKDFSAARGNWLQVVAAAQEILSESSKDLEVCALLVEGLVRTDGIEGVRDGFTLSARLVRDFWEALHPHLDPDDPDSLEDRLAAFNGLDGAAQPGTLARYILLLPITDCSGENFAGYQLDQAISQGGSDGDSSTLGFTLEDIQSAAQQTPLSFYIDLTRTLEEAEAARADLDAQFTELCGFDAPASSRTREALEALTSHVRFLAADRIAAAEAEAAAGPAAAAAEGAEGEAAATGDGTAAVAIAGKAVPAGAIQNRADAIGRLRKVADWFRDNEPHSPLSYSLDNLVRWANMPLDRLIEEWIQDDSALERYRLMTGMTARDDE